MTDGTGALTVPGLMLEVSDVVHAYGPVIALDHVSISARRGEFLTILGESGSGKTTLLRVISGLERAMSVAALRINNEEVADKPAALRNCTTVFQNYALFPHMSVEENVAYGLKFGAWREMIGTVRYRTRLAWSACMKSRRGASVSFPAVSASASRWRAPS